MDNSLRSYILIIFGGFIFIIGWHFTTQFKLVPTYILPTISETLSYAYNQRNEVLINTWTTLIESFIGMLLSIGFGYLLALILHIYKPLKTAFYLHILWLRSLPIIAIAPMVTLYLGNDISGKIFIAFFISFFSVVVSSLKGLDAVPEELSDYFKLLRVNRYHDYIHLRIPFSIPYLFVGAKIASSVSVIGAIVGEFVGSNKGLGYLIIMASHRLEAPAMMVSILISGLLTLILYGIISLLELLVKKRGFGEAISSI